MIETFESFNKRQLKPRKKAKGKINRCIGKCERKFFIKNNKPIIYCPSCDRTFGK